MAVSIEDLLLSIAAGDREAFRLLYRQRAAKLLGITLRITGDRAMAEDAMQEAFIEVWRRAHRYDAQRGRGDSWLATVARNRAIDLIRRRGRKVAPGEDAGDDALVPVVDPKSAADGGVEFMALADCLGRLGETHREAVMMAYYWGATREEISERLGAPVNTIKTWLRRSLAALRECLDA